MDPTIEMGRQVDEGLYEEAFSKALGRAVQVEPMTLVSSACAHASSVCVVQGYAFKVFVRRSKAL